jgi:putative lipoic acid-binding regulatory protein
MSEESAIEFPCAFPIKMMGRDTAKFRATARALIENHVGPVDEDAIRFNQLDDIYRDVSGHDDVLMAL